MFVLGNDPADPDKKKYDDVRRSSEVILTASSAAMRSHESISIENSYFKCTECDQTCKTCRGETATDGFDNPGWVEDKSQCLQPCPADETGAGSRDLPYFIKEEVVELVGDELTAKVARDKKSASDKGIEYTAPVPNPYGVT